MRAELEVSNFRFSLVQGLKFEWDFLIHLHNACGVSCPGLSYLYDEAVEVYSWEGIVMVCFEYRREGG